MTNSIVLQLQQGYEYQETLFECQPAIHQRFLECQAQVIADALMLYLLAPLEKAFEAANL